MTGTAGGGGAIISTLGIAGLVSTPPGTLLLQLYSLSCYAYFGCWDGGPAFLLIQVE